MDWGVDKTKAAKVRIVFSGTAALGHGWGEKGTFTRVQVSYGAGLEDGDPGQVSSQGICDAALGIQAL